MSVIVGQRLWIARGERLLAMHRSAVEQRDESALPVLRHPVDTKEGAVRLQEMVPEMRALWTAPTLIHQCDAERKSGGITRDAETQDSRDSE